MRHERNCNHLSTIAEDTLCGGKFLEKQQGDERYMAQNLLKTGINIKSIVQLATKYSGHLLSTKNLLAMLVDSKRFHVDSGFQLLQPIYDITPIQIEEYLKILIKQHFLDNKK